MYALAMSIIVIASGPNDSDDSIERMQPSMQIEVRGSFFMFVER